MAEAPPNPMQASLPTALLYDDLFKVHETPPGHPESVRRLDAIMGALARADFGGDLKVITRSPLNPPGSMDPESNEAGNEVQSYYTGIGRGVPCASYHGRTRRYQT